MPVILQFPTERRWSHIETVPTKGKFMKTNKHVLNNLKLEKTKRREEFSSEKFNQYYPTDKRLPDNCMSTKKINGVCIYLLKTLSESLLIKKREVRVCMCIVFY